MNIDLVDNFDMNFQNMTINEMYSYSNVLDMTRAASNSRHVNEPIPNPRVQDFNEDFHGLSQDELKKYKSWPGLIYASRSKMVNSLSKQLKRWLRSPKSFILHQLINGHDFWDSYEVSPHIGIF